MFPYKNPFFRINLVSNVKTDDVILYKSDFKCNRTVMLSCTGAVSNVTKRLCYSYKFDFKSYRTGNDVLYKSDFKC